MQKTNWLTESAEWFRSQAGSVRQLWAALTIGVLVAGNARAIGPQLQTTAYSSDTTLQLIPVESVDAATRSRWLIDGTVVDAQTSERIKKFTVTPGSLSTDEQGKSSVRWRDNLKREMTDGRLRWPRTSGFSVMRFRITADAYSPAITQRIWRGGPHTRIKVRMRPITDGSNKSSR